MRHIHHNDDGSIAVWGHAPYRIIRQSDNATFNVQGIRRRNGRCVLYGGWAESGDGAEIDVGDDKFDPADLDVNSLPGYVCVFPDIDWIKSKLHPDNAVRVVGLRETSKQELITAGFATLHAPTGRLIHDHSYRAAWIDNAGRVGFDMAKAREIHRDKLRVDRMAQFTQLDIDQQRALVAKDDAQVAAIEAQKQVLRDLPDDPRIDAAATVDELKQITVATGPDPPNIIGRPDAVS